MASQFHDSVIPFTAAAFYFEAVPVLWFEVAFRLSDKRSSFMFSWIKGCARCKI